MPVWKWILLLILALFLALLMYGFASMPSMFMKGWGAWVLAVAASAAMLALYRVFAHLFEGAYPQDLPLKKLVPHLALGMGIGIVSIGLVAGVMMALGLYTVDSVNKVWKDLIDPFLMFLVVAVGEEVAFRGVLFRWIDERFGFWWALVASALIFGLIHITNDNATLWSSVAIAIEAGLLLGIAYKWSGNLWVPIGFHWTWNFVQGNIFGFAVSGNDSGASLIQATIEGPQWLTGGPFGAEASVISMVVCLGFTALLLKNYLSKE